MRPADFAGLRPARPSDTSRRDLQRIGRSDQLARLGQVTQAFPVDWGVSTRLTHSREVAGIARTAAAALGLDEDLAEAIGMGHDCGHAPFGHAGEMAIRTVLPGWHHGEWAGRHVLPVLGLSAACLDGIARHSWSSSAPMTPEGHVVRWADRIAYVTRDYEDARALFGQMPPRPAGALLALGETRPEQRAALVEALTEATLNTGVIAMRDEAAKALGQLRMYNSRHIYGDLRLEVVTQQRADDVVLHLYARLGLAPSRCAVLAAVSTLTGKTDLDLAKRGTNERPMRGVA